MRRYAAVNEASRVHGELIRTVRMGLKMTQAELAEKFGVWRETISRIETGRFDVTRPKYKIFNERLRIWAEMNRKRRMKPVATLEGLLPHEEIPEVKFWRELKKRYKEKKNGGEKLE